MSKARIRAGMACRLLVLAILLCGFGSPHSLAQPQNVRGDLLPVVPLAAGEAEDLAAQQAHPNPRMQFRVLREAMWAPLNDELDAFGEARYQALKPQILNQDIPALQLAVSQGQFSYTDLVLFYLYRIRHYESQPDRYLNALIALNPDVLNDARERDRQRSAAPDPVNPHSVFGMPILLKDNIGTDGMDTTAGALALANNAAPDAFITARLREQGAIILGKANLSEWAYFFCNGCPLGYSAMGGQTLNPYGRKRLETGGSSSGSAVAVAANYAVAAVGSETSGSILSPASANALVGLKPTTGMLSRSGIVPISSTLDTPGPIARSVTDAVILFNAMTGYDQADTAMPLLSTAALLRLEQARLAGVRLGYFSRFMDTPRYAEAVERLRQQGALLFEIQQPDVQMQNFSDLLGGEMKRDLALYLAAQADSSVPVDSVDDVRNFNGADMDLRAPYGQALFDAVSASSLTDGQLVELRGALRDVARQVLQAPLAQLDLQALLSMNNSHAGFAAASNFPAITLPLGLNDEQAPIALTMIGPSFSEQMLTALAAAVEAVLPPRPLPGDYQ